MKKILFTLLALAAVILMISFHAKADDPHYLDQIQNQQWRHNNSPFAGGATLIFDPAGVTVASTTIPIHIASSTVLLVLQSVSSSITISPVAADLQTQTFINQNGDIEVFFPVQSTTLATNRLSRWSINLDPVIVATGSYPFKITLYLNAASSSATGTLIAQ